MIRASKTRTQINLARQQDGGGKKKPGQQQQDRINPNNRQGNQRTAVALNGLPRDWTFAWLRTWRDAT
jgi:hypothetical protein